MKTRILRYTLVALFCGACNLLFGLRQALIPAAERSGQGAETIIFWVGSYTDHESQGIPAGCGDYLLPVDTGVMPSGDIESDLRVALEALFDPEQNHPEAEGYDRVKQLELSIESISIRVGAAQVKLHEGLWGIGHCGDAILEAQILRTIFQFESINAAVVADGKFNLRQFIDESDRFSEEQLRHWVYQRHDKY